MDHDIESIKILHELFEQGVLTKEEFEIKKQQILNMTSANSLSEANQKNENAKSEESDYVTIKDKTKEPQNRKKKFSSLMLGFILFMVFVIAGGCFLVL